jgi:hypothetical protein
MTGTARRFGLLDAVVLMAALALAFYLVRICLYETAPILKHRSALRLSFAVRITHDVYAACIAALGGAMIVLRLRRPRPRLMDVLRQPGFAGCIASTLVFGTCILSTMPNQDVSSVLFLASIANAYVITGVWFAVLYANFWHPEHGWIDRMARVVCVSWLVLPFVRCLCLAT